MKERWYAKPTIVSTGIIQQGKPSRSQTKQEGDIREQQWENSDKQINIAILKKLIRRAFSDKDIGMRLEVRFTCSPLI